MSRPSPCSFVLIDGYVSCSSYCSWKKATDGTVAGEHKGMNWKLIKSGLLDWQVHLATLALALSFRLFLIMSDMSNYRYISIVTPLYSYDQFIQPRRHRNGN